MVSVTQELYRYWENEYKKQDSLDQFKVEDNHFKNISINMRNKFKLEYYPQPFYGYFEEDMSKDLLMPLINPGPVPSENVMKQYPSNSLVESRELWNKEIYERHTNQWRKENFHQKELEYDRIYGGENKHWRGKKMKQVRNLLGQDIEFLHTIEFFPFHSDKWGGVSEIDRENIYNLPSTTRSICALEDSASRRLVKHILGVGKEWVNILNHYSNKFKLVEYRELLGPKGNIGQRFYKYILVNNPEGLPIVIYVTSAINIPNPDRNINGANIIYEFLEI